MKFFDDSTKKLIKNFAALLVSALVLIAATVAWFTSRNTSTVARPVATMNARDAVNNFYQMDETFGLIAVDNSGFDGVDTLAEQVESDDWEVGSDWSIAELIPGVYRQYMMAVKSTGTPSLHITGFDCDFSDDSLSTAENEETVWSSIYLQAAAFTKSGSTYTQVGSDTCGCLADLLDDGEIDIVFDSNTASEFYVVINIGVPGEDDYDLHQALQTLGATVSFGEVSASSGS